MTTPATLDRRPWMDDELLAFQDAIRKVFEREFAPDELRWRREHRTPREIWRRAGATGLLCASIPEAYGGHGGSFLHEAVIASEQARAAAVAGAFAVVSTLQGGPDVIVDAQLALLRAARAAGARRFIPSDYSYNVFTLPEGINVNSDWRRALAVAAQREATAAWAGYGFGFAVLAALAAISLAARFPS